MSGEGRSLTLESDVDDGVVLGLGIFVNLHKLFCDKTVLSVCVDAGWLWMQLMSVEKSVFSIWVDLLLCRSIQLLVLSYAEMSVYMYLSQLMSTFTKLSKGASSSRWFLQSMTRRTSDSTITHMYLYSHVSQI